MIRLNKNSCNISWLIFDFSYFCLFIVLASACPTILSIIKCKSFVIIERACSFRGSFERVSSLELVISFSFKITRRRSSVTTRWSRSRTVSVTRFRPRARPWIGPWARSTSALVSARHVLNNSKFIFEWTPWFPLAPETSSLIEMRQRLNCSHRQRADKLK